MVFKDRAACCRCDFVLPSFCFSLAPLSTSGAAFSISNRLPCQATVAAPFHRFASFGFNTALPRFVSSCRGGAEPTSLPLPLSTRFVDSFFRPSTSSSPVRLLRFEGLRLLPPPLPESTSLADFLFRLSLLSSGASAANAASPSRPRGCGFYHRPVRSQPRTHDSVFLLSTRSGDPAASAASSSRPRGAPSTTASSGVNTLLRLHLPGSSGLVRGRTASSPMACLLPPPLSAYARSARKPLGGASAHTVLT